MTRWRECVRQLVSVLGLFLLAGLGKAALDPELTTPYKMQVVVRFADNRDLTPIFRERVLRELRESLHAALGAMGQVEVFDLTRVAADQRPPLWRDVESRGLLQGLGDGKGTSDAKTHFLSIDYVEGQYTVQARQYDGLTGLASATVRSERTPDRSFVARIAALLVDQDFGLVGTVVEAPDVHRVRIAFKGGQLGVPLDRWVKKDDVFALVQMQGGESGLRSTRVAWSVLQAMEPADKGGCWCRVFQPRAKSLTDGAGYRCLKLGTIRGPLKIRIVRDAARNPAAYVDVHVRRNGFTDEEADKVQGATDIDGYFSTEGRKVFYDQLAFVSVRYAGNLQAQVPIPIVDDRTQTVRVNLTKDASAQLLFRKGLWESGLYEELLAQNEVVKSLNALLKANKHKEALDKAQKSLEMLLKSLAAFTQEQKELAVVPSATRLDLSQGAARLAELGTARDHLQGFLSAVERIVKEENDPARIQAKTIYEQARILEDREADYGKAIELYEQAQAGANDAKLGERLKRLKAVWETKDDKHREARTFIFTVWAQEVNAATMLGRIDEARRAFEVCRDRKDPLGPRRLLKVATLHSARLAKQLEGLSPDVNDGDVKPARELAEVIEKMVPLLRDVNAHVAQTPVP